jgi:hypothetical protein
MSLASLETIAENDAVKDFLGEMGLSATGILTSLKKSGATSYDWIGGVAAEFLNWAPDEPKATGECATIKSIGLSAADCDVVSNFICEAKNEKETTATEAAITTTEAVDPFNKLLSIAEGICQVQVLANVSICLPSS